MKVLIPKEECFASDVADRMQRHEHHLSKLAKMVRIDEAKLPDYPHPLLPMKKTKNPFTAVSAYAFGRSIIKAMLP